MKYYSQTIITIATPELSAEDQFKLRTHFESEYEGAEIKIDVDTNLTEPEVREVSIPPRLDSRVEQIDPRTHKVLKSESIGGKTLIMSAAEHLSKLKF